MNDLQEKLENIAAFKLHSTYGMCRQEYKREQDAVLAQLARMHMKKLFHFLNATLPK
jgi:hypothetical protein